MERIRVAALVFSLLLLLQIIRAVRREHIRVEYSMAWFGAAVLLLALSISEPTLRWLSLTLGIDDPSLVFGSHCGSAIPVYVLPRLSPNIGSEGQQHPVGPKNRYPRVGNQTSGLGDRGSTVRRATRSQGPRREP